MIRPQIEVPVRDPFWRRLFSWRAARRVLAAFAVLGALVTLAFFEEDWRGNRTWARYKSELEAKGEKLDWKDNIPAPVPDDQNFAMTPFLAPLFEYNPTPLPPGRVIWRDTNGYNRAVNFWKEIKLSLGWGGWDRGRFSDLSSAFLKIRADGTNAAGLAHGAPSRPATAAQILRAVETVQPLLDELRAASSRPFARFNLPYTSDFLDSVTTTHLMPIRAISHVFQARALAELELGMTEAALSDTEMVLYLAETLKDEPFYLAELVRTSLLELAIQPVWEGLARRQWSESRLADLERRLRQMEFLTHRVLRSERAFDLRILEKSCSGGKLEVLDESGTLETAKRDSPWPRGWFALAEADTARVYQQVVFTWIDPVNQRAFPARVAAADAGIEKTLRGGFSPDRFLVRFMFSALTNAPIQIAFAQNALNLARIGCALERFRLADGQFPETLAALGPRFLDSIPHDVITGEPLKYHRQPDGRFILYSVGWNEKDDGGKVETKPGTPDRVDPARGDWVWKYPE